MSFRNKIIVIFILISFTSYFAAIALLIIRSIEISERSEIQIMENSFQELKHSMDRVFTDIEKMSSLYILDERLRDITITDTRYISDENYITNLSHVNNVVRLAKRLNPYVLGVTFITKYDDVYTNTDQTKTDIGKYYEWIEQLDNTEEKVYYSSIYEGFFMRGKRYMLSIIQPMEDLILGAIGYVIIDIDFNVLQGIIDDTFLRNEIGIQILQDNEIIYSKNTLENHDDTRFLSHYGYLPVLNWEVIQSVSKLNIYKKAFYSAKSYILILLPISLLSIIFLFIVISKLIKPITVLSHHISDMRGNVYEKGHKIDYTGHANDEISILYNSFNEFITSLQESIQKEYTAKMNQKHMELLMLQSQINPHYMYNTLNLISSIAILNNVDDISEICNELSDILRYSIKTDLNVKLSDELDIVKKYTDLQQRRHPGKIMLTVDVPEKLLEVQVQRFMIQPLVENSIKHGIEKNNEAVSISISGRIEHHILELEIKDNGRGIPQEKLKEIENLLSAHSCLMNQKGFGIQNVHYRIQDYYGEEFGLSIESAENKWTLLKIRIPSENVLLLNEHSY